jgi:hypothetical protein
MLKLSALYWYPILTEVGMCWQSFMQLPNIQFHVNPSSYFRVLYIHPDWLTGKYGLDDTDILFWISLLPKCRKLKSFVFFCSNISRYAENCYWLCPPRFVTLVGLLFVTTFRSVIQEFSSLKLSFIKWLVSWNLFHFLIAFPITLLGQFPKRISWQHSIISSSTHYET